ncbi:cytochrome c oxidase subunit 6B family protein [Pleurotus pulmonarius]
MGSSSSKVADAAPTRQDRQKCWEARDSYFACLDRAGVVKAGDEGKACKDENEKYEANCAKSWIEQVIKPRTPNVCEPLYRDHSTWDNNAI